MFKIEPGFWNCCKAKPAKIVAFDDDRDGAPKDALVWHYACKACASTVHPSRVMDTPEAPKEEEPKCDCGCTTPDTYHYTGCALLKARFKEFTADGAPITDGMAVWDYNLEPGFVSLSRLGNDGWFDVCKPGQTRGNSMNAVRVCVRHPSTNQLASDALKGK